MMDPGLVEFSVQLVHDLADRFNFTNRGTTFATHDVPGITRAAIPIFKKMGLNAINIGVDRASAVPATGPVCYNSVRCITCQRKVQKLVPILPAVAWGLRL